MFERFRQADPAMTRTHGGLGLGLSIVRELVELHGGTILAESEGLGKGATFTVDLPAAKVNKRTPTRTLEPSASRYAGTLKSKSILLVEDDADTAAGIAQLLKSAGAEVTHHATAVDALQHFQTQPHNLLLSDIGLPGMDGLALIRAVRSHEKQSGKAEMVAVALTAFAQESDQTAARTAGFNAFVTKPFDPGLLIELLARLLQRKR